MIKSLQYGGGSDLWNVSKADFKLFRDVSNGFIEDSNEPRRY